MWIYVAAAAAEHYGNVHFKTVKMVNLMLLFLTLMFKLCYWTNCFTDS